MLVRFNKRTDIGGVTYGPESGDIDLQNDLANEIVRDGNGVIVGRGDLAGEVSLKTVNGQAVLVGPDGAEVELGGPSTGRKIAILGNSIVQQGASMPNASGHGAWSSSTSTTATNTIVPNQMMLNAPWSHLYYTATTTGTTGTVEPVWPNTIGETVVDGSVTWQATAVRSDYPMWGWGFWTWAQQLSGQRLEEVYVNGMGGKQSNEILLYVDRALACSPDIVFFSAIFENDVWAGVAPTLSTIQARWDAAVIEFDKVRNAGKTLMLQTVLPSGYIDGTGLFTGYSSGTGTKAWTWLNQKISEYADTYPDTILWDAANVYIDANPANPVWPENTITYAAPSGSGQQLKKTDGIHPYTSAGYLLAKSLAALIVSRYSAVERFSTANDSYNRAVNPLNFGTSGTSITGISSGTPANLMSMAAYGTVTSAALSKVARTDKAGEFQRCTYVATAGDNLTYSPINPYENVGVRFAVGDFVQCFAEIKVEANPVKLGGLFARIHMFNGVPVNIESSVAPSSTAQDMGQMITEDTLFTVKTFPAKVPAGTTAMQMFAKVTAYGAANFAVQFGKMSIERVTMPSLV